MRQAPDGVYSYLVDLEDTKIAEMVRENEDCTYTILLNSRFNHERNQTSYLHALKHIQNGDYEKESVQEIEAEAHK